MARLEQLVVRRAGDDLALQLGQRLVVDHTAERARGVDVDRRREDLIGVHRHRTKLVHHALHPLSVDVAHDQPRTGAVQLLAEVVADVPQSLHGDALSGKRRRTPPLECRRLDRAEDTVRRDRRRIPRSRGKPGHEFRLHVHVIHVGRARAHVLGRDVATAERVHEPPVGAEEHLALRCAIVADDHGLAAAQIEPGDGVLVRHPARQTQGVDQRRLVRGVLPEARPAQRGPERRVVDRDDAAVSAGLVVAHDDLLMAHVGDRIEDVHRE